MVALVDIQCCAIESVAIESCAEALTDQAATGYSLNHTSSRTAAPTLHAAVAASSVVASAKRTLRTRVKIS